MDDCTHSWSTCPVHGTVTGDLPPLRDVLTCVYGGLETKAGTPFDEHDSDAVISRLVERL